MFFFPLISPLLISMSLLTHAFCKENILILVSVFQNSAIFKFKIPHLHIFLNNFFVHCWNEQSLHITIDAVYINNITLITDCFIELHVCMSHLGYC